MCTTMRCNFNYLLFPLLSPPPCSPSSVDLLPVFSHGKRWTNVASSSLLLLEVWAKPGYTLSALKLTHNTHQFEDVLALFKNRITRYLKVIRIKMSAKTKNRNTINLTSTVGELILYESLLYIKRHNG